MAFEVPDMSGWTDAERGEWYYQNRDHVDEIFDGEKVTFFFYPDSTLTTREVPMTLRQAREFDNIQRWHKEHAA